jgi:hypothetical protein
MHQHGAKKYQKLLRCPNMGRGKNKNYYATPTWGETITKIIMPPQHGA